MKNNKLNDFITFKIIENASNVDNCFLENDDDLEDDFDDCDDCDNDSCLENDDDLDYEEDYYDDDQDDNVDYDKIIESSYNYTKNFSFKSKKNDNNLNKTIKISLDLGKTSLRVFEEIEKKMKSKLQYDYLYQDESDNLNNNESQKMFIYDSTDDNSSLISNAKVIIEIDDVTSDNLVEILKRVMDSLDK